MDYIEYSQDRDEEGVVSEENLRKISPIISDLRHEIYSPLNALSGHIDLYREDADLGNMSHLEESTIDQLSEFVDAAEYVVEHTELLGTLPEDEVEKLNSYADEIDIDGNLGGAVRRIASVSNDVLNYQEKLLSGETGDRSEIADLLEPLEESARNMGGELDSGYNGMEEEVADVNSGFRILFWTLGKNWQDHAYQPGEDIDFGFDVSEEADRYIVEVWDTGDGLFDQYPDSMEDAEDLRYGEARQLINSEDKGGHGLTMTSNVAEVYDATIDYSEDMFEDSGFGLQIGIPKYQNSTSESS